MLGEELGDGLGRRGRLEHTRTVWTESSLLDGVQEGPTECTNARAVPSSPAGTAAADPTMTAKIIDSSGATRATLVVSRSELE